MGAASLPLSRSGRRPSRAALVVAFVVAWSLLALVVVVLAMSGAIQPEEQIVAPFRWFYGDAKTA